MKKIYITDLDGTLLNKESVLSQKSRIIINRFIEKGGIFTYATARSYNSAKIVTQGLNINIPIIIFNGAFVYDIQKNKFLHSVYFSENEIENLIEISNCFGFTPLVYTFINGEEKIMWNKNGILSEGFRYYLSKRKSDKRMCPVSNLKSSFKGKIFYVTFIESYNELLPLYENIKSDSFFNSVFQQELYRTEYWCEIMPKSVNKATAVNLLKDILKCDELTVFGDSLNDIPMFEIADHSYAVMNANDRLKQIATDIIGYNYDDGVALKLSEIENIKV